MSKLLRALGLMSGTSLDGIDVAVLDTDGESVVERGPSTTYPYTPQQQARLHAALQAAKPITDRTARPGILALVERELTDWHATAVHRFCEEYRLNFSEIDLIGFHGQTVLHRPDIRLTVQIGDGPALARRCGVAVVFDMRAADVAAGGQGAPLVPAYHRALAAGIADRPLAFVNIGGVANMTWIGREGALVAFDTGPGNALLDDWCARHTGIPFDRDGRLAASGTVHDNALAALAGNPFFATAAPKSLDRNHFDVAGLEGLSPADGAATLTRFTALAIARAVDHVPERPVLSVICGGGRHNPTLLREIRDLLEPRGERVLTAEQAGLDGDAMEAEAWAYLAVRCLKGLPITFPGTTGAPRPLAGGVVARP